MVQVWSLKRSKAANGAGRVVGIVGRGHLRGMVYAMEAGVGSDLRFTDLVGGRNTKAYKEGRNRRLALDVVRDTVLFGALAWAWSLWAPGHQ